MLLITKNSYTPSDADDSQRHKYNFWEPISDVSYSSDRGPTEFSGLDSTGKQLDGYKLCGSFQSHWCTNYCLTKNSNIDD